MTKPTGTRAVKEVKEAMRKAQSKRKVVDKPLKSQRQQLKYLPLPKAYSQRPIANSLQPKAAYDKLHRNTLLLHGLVCRDRHLW